MVVHDKKSLLSWNKSLLLAAMQGPSPVDGGLPLIVSRHPKLALRTPATLSLARATATDQGSLDNYFDELESTLEENQLLDKPCLIFNMDETGMPLEPKTSKKLSPGKVTRILHKYPAVFSPRLPLLAVLVWEGSACLPLLFGIGRIFHLHELATDEVPGTVYGLSSKR